MERPRQAGGSGGPRRRRSRGWLARATSTHPRWRWDKSTRARLAFSFEAEGASKRGLVIQRRQRTAEREAEATTVTNGGPDARGIGQQGGGAPRGRVLRRRTPMKKGSGAATPLRATNRAGRRRWLLLQREIESERGQEEENKEKGGAGERQPGPWGNEDGLLDQARDGASPTVARVPGRRQCLGDGAGQGRRRGRSGEAA